MLKMKFSIIYSIVFFVILFTGCGNEQKALTQSTLQNMTKDIETESNHSEFIEAKKHWLQASQLKRDLNQSEVFQKRSKKNELFSTFGLGYGGPSAYRFANQDDTGSIWMSVVDLALDPKIGENPYYQNIKNFQPQQFNNLSKYLSKSKYLIYWLPQGWDENWFSIKQIQLAIDRGLTPVFMYWYFGDKLVNGMPTYKERIAYYKNSRKLGKFLKKLHGQKIVIMEPEFNKPPVMESKKTQRKFASTISRSISKIKYYGGRDILFSLCMLDTGSRGINSTYSSCGYDNCALGDKKAWSQTEYIYKRLLRKLDFISFQQMIGQFSRDPLNSGTWDNPNPKSYTEEQLSTNLLSERINNFTTFLHEKYKKPIMMPYITIASATWNDSNKNNKIEESELDLSGWEYKAEQIYQDLYTMRDTLKSNGLFGYAPLSIFDNPSQDKGGYQYFLNNEYHLGIIKTGAKDEIDDKLDGDLSYKGDVLDYIYTIN